MICPSCGAENRKTARFCQRCGQPLLAVNPSPPEGAGSSTQPLPVNLDLPVTRPLPEANGAFAPLPEGALLLDDRYVITETRAVGPLNVYQVEDNVAVRLCSLCHAVTDDPDELYCSSCGAELGNATPLHLRYLLRESPDEAAFATEALLLEKRLSHPGLLLPLRVFSDIPYGPKRFYLLERETVPELADKLALPQEVNQVLEWGVPLAQALAYLHRHGVVLRQVSLSHIGVTDKAACWVMQPGVALIPSSPNEAAAYMHQNVRGLAMALFHLATGQERYDTQADLPPRVKEFFAQALAAEPGFADATVFGAELEAVLQELLRPATVTLVVGSRTDVGQVRNLNEDGLLTLTVNPVLRSVAMPVGLFVVADGMGGHEAGDVASMLTIQTIGRQAAADLIPAATAGAPLPAPRDWLIAATQAANRAVYERRRAAGSDMGSTLVMALLTGNIATIANVGDSRAYLLKSNGIAQLTIDHSLVERMVATGQITREEAAHHPQKNVIYRVIGDKSQIEADLFEQRLAPGEALLLCSDGLSGMIDDQQIEHIWRTSTSPQDACDRLVEAANEAGGEDNITVIIVQVIR